MLLQKSVGKFIKTFKNLVKNRYFNVIVIKSRIIIILLILTIIKNGKLCIIIINNNNWKILAKIKKNEKLGGGVF